MWFIVLDLMLKRVSVDIYIYDEIQNHFNIVKMLNKRQIYWSFFPFFSMILVSLTDCTDLKTLQPLSRYVTRIKSQWQ